MKKAIPILLMLFVSLQSGVSQDTDEPENRQNDVADLIRQLRRLNITHPESDSDSIILQQKKRIELSNRILDHEDVQESERISAMATKLRAFGIHFAIVFREKAQDEELFAAYSTAIDDGLDDYDQGIVMEATTAAARFHSAVFSLDPTEEKAHQAAEALTRLDEVAVKDPMIQSSRRLMLERLWKSDKPKLVFQKLAKAQDKASIIVLDQIDGTTKKDHAEFLWAKHFARFGDFVAQRRLAEMYETGNGTRRNNSQAARWYTKLAESGDLSARIKLGDFYLAGKGYSKNPETAVGYYREAATKDRSRVAQFKLALCYLHGTGVTESDDNWRKWIKSAAFNASGREVQSVYQTIDFAQSADSFRIFYESLVDQYPDNIYYLNNLAYSLLISSEKEPQRALDLIEEAIDISPDDFSNINSFLDTKATALKQLGRWKKAAKVFESILDEVDDKLPVLESLIECFNEFDKEKADKYRDQLDELEKLGFVPRLNNQWQICIRFERVRSSLM